VSVRADRIQKYIRDFILLALPASGFINEVFVKDKPELSLILLFFGMAISPAAFGVYELRQQGRDTIDSVQRSQSSPPSPSQSQSSSGTS
jgi:hypothetical protein